MLCALAEFGEGVKSASPGDAALLDGGYGGAEEGVEEKGCSSRKENGVPGGDSGVTAR